MVLLEEWHLQLLVGEQLADVVVTQLADAFEVQLRRSVAEIKQRLAVLVPGAQFEVDADR